MSRHKHKLFLIAVLLFILSLACNAQLRIQPSTSDTKTPSTEEEVSKETPSQGETVEAFISADEGGTVEHPAGITLSFPPGSLSEDTEVRVANLGFNQPTEQNPSTFFKLSESFKIELGSGHQTGELTLSLHYPDQASFEIAPSHILLGHDGVNNQQWLRPVVADEEERIAEARLRELFPPEKDEDDEPQTRIVALDYVVPFQMAEDLPILHVPFYSQSGLSWCTPTALAMQFNYHSDLYEITSNYEVAGQVKLDRGTKGITNYKVMDELDTDGGLYEFFYWDDDLIVFPQPNRADQALAFQGTAFTSYVQWQIAGFNSHEALGERIFFQSGDERIWFDVPLVVSPPRPVQLTADTANHAFVAVGANEENIWLHDSSGAFTVNTTPIAEKMAWSQFKNSAFTNSNSNELRSIVLYRPVRPEEARHGSIVLLQRQNANSLSYTDDIYTGATSRWAWDGDDFNQGYKWLDTGNDDFPDHSTYKNAFRLAGSAFGTLDYQAWIANVTPTDRTFTLDVILVHPNEDVTLEDRYTVDQTGFSWGMGGGGQGSNPNISGTLNPDAVTEPGEYRLIFRLKENDVIQDGKLVRFQVNQDEPPPPELKISSPKNNQAFSEFDAISFTANVIDVEANEEDYDISWRYERDTGSSDFLGNTGDQETLDSRDLCDGSYIVTAEAKNPFTGRTLTDEVSFTINQPDRIPEGGACAPEVFIESPENKESFDSNDTILLKATIRDDHPEIDEPIFPLNWYVDNDNLNSIASDLEASYSTTYIDPGPHTIIVRYGSARKSLWITVDEEENHGPTANIRVPDNKDSFPFDESGITTVHFEGVGLDPEDGQLAGDQLEWRYRVRSSQGWIEGETGSEISLDFDVGCGDSWYEVQLVVTDSEGEKAKHTISIRIEGPEC